MSKNGSKTVQQVPVARLGALLNRASLCSDVDREWEGVEVRDVVSDSRRVTPGSLFVAVCGPRADGATFIGDAVRRGAVAVVVEAGHSVEPGPVVVRVPNSRRALAAVTAAFHGLDTIQASGGLRVVGVTGTNGKSTVGFMTRAILREAGHRVALLGTIEYDLVGRTIPAALTTPDPEMLTRHLVESHAAGADIAVMEVSSHSLAQHRTDAVQFSVAAFTNLTQDHLDYHGSPEDYLEAKRRLFDGLSKDSVGIVNADEPVSDRIVERCDGRIVRYGFSERAAVRASRVREDINGSRFVLEHGDDAIEFRTSLIGRYNIANALAATAIALEFDVDLTTAGRGLASLQEVPGRLQRVATEGEGYQVFVDYAHTDDALRNVLGATKRLTGGKLWCVFGCGGDRDRTKRPLMARAVADLADAIVVTSDNPRSEEPRDIIRGIEQGLTESDRRRTMVEPDRAAAIEKAIERLNEGDTLVIAGKGHEDYQIVGATRVHFDDFEVARDAIARRRSGKA